ncbi:MAG: hypothetical protein A2534_04285 [Candidatus Magasanikbacteria bacterium RIFOXYD2_FULL_39_9]|uniref:Uncharacterized protein n=1 Tax=Candidatus Magasanikbacteria bacterium RIFOXYD1_FULL_40_23 TaxID=1798705 RepID=A0A1F6PB58_9BACT|nr:MAG: hypothetical protein A2534_04285 [Candidatus Magasanikbacteria bacterium RIFOXYD2_FULL_39_9]OGH93406.1 MAG: hypothetical protein A2563_02245 [Candidatus Magasanikbacteria bacterium RIFOXYD1_FULL_40_23]
MNKLASAQSVSIATLASRIHSDIASDLSNLDHDDDVWAAIMNYDLSVVTDTFARRNPQYAENANALEMECRRFMYLTVIVPNFELAPTKPIDEYWHTFILFTREYDAFCRMLSGRYVHHKPLGAADHSAVFAKTQKIVAHLFGEFENSHFWFLPAPSTSCCSARAVEDMRSAVV